MGLIDLVLWRGQNPFQNNAPLSFLAALKGLFDRDKNIVVNALKDTIAPAPKISISISNEQDTVARTLWGEARNEGRAGMIAIANVIANRVKSNKKAEFGSGFVGVCLKPSQFSAWNPKTGGAVDPSIKKNYDMMVSVRPSDSNFKIALDIAKLAIDGKLRDTTNGAVFYKTFDATFGKIKTVGNPVFKTASHEFFRYEQLVKA